MLEKIRELLLNYYSKIDKEAVIPQKLLPTVIETMLESGIKSVRQFVYYENAYNNKQVFDSLKNNSSGTQIYRYYILQYLKQANDKKFVNLMAKDREVGISATACVLSKAKIELLPPVMEFILFDDSVAIINTSTHDSENILTEDNKEISKCLRWLEVAEDQKGIIYSDDFLQEPIMQSADMIYEVAGLFCTSDHVNSTSCCWYHSMWQYMRLLNIVSTPSWHHEFYTSKLFENITDDSDASVFISGTADYSMLAYVLNVARRRHINADVTVIDLCKTPLFACEWYAHKMSHPITTLQQSVFDVDEEKKYDLVCADAFLTRFKGSDFKRVVSKWHNLLKSGGIAVTTIRIHDGRHICPPVPLDAAVQKFKEKAVNRMSAWENHINLTAEEIGRKAEYYAKNMVSNRLGTEDEILNGLRDCGFEISYQEEAEVVGELYPSLYLRVVLKKV